MSERLVYIWSNEHRAWWKPGNEGYTKDLHLAGLYDIDEARKICLGALYGSRRIPNEVMVPRDMDAVYQDYHRHIGRPFGS